MSELLLGGIAASLACFFTNPLEVVKTRVQLQGELKARGAYYVHYRNVFHAFYAMAKHESLLSLQKGLVPAIYYQFVMNGFRLGFYQCLDNYGFTRNEKNEVVFVKSVAAGAFSGVAGAYAASPLYMIKTQLQAKSCIGNPVGYQHSHNSMTEAFRSVYQSYGIKGLWRGVTSSIARVSVGSAIQLTTFSKLKDILHDKKIIAADSSLNTLCAATIGGTVVTACMTPFDVVATRLYNQPVDPKTGKGLIYSGITDCITKIIRTESFLGLYKGWSAVLFRLGPHTVLSLFFWREIRKIYFDLKVPSTIPIKASGTEFSKVVNN
ncbi:solute carrier family 25 member 35-like protein [Dinothrombium tinctorium]|uniref:Solute carrier family 25 member 35-like protein n=1 Tax=Dinothrombium tinctorium TaxID=1965070 RepID=A0A3S3PAB1_9ACAR|nr:solute carrier family 25 member 35-like protein [Dinothrombium tinctorium]